MAFRVIDELAIHDNFEGLCQVAVNEGYELQHINSVMEFPFNGRGSQLRLVAVFYRENK